MDHADRRRRLAARLSELQADAFLVTAPANVRYLTGFTGSNGQLVVTREDTVFFTDGRYDEQSGHEVPDLSREIYTGEFAPAFRAVCRRLRARRVAFEAAAVTVETHEKLGEEIELISTSDQIEGLRIAKDPEELAKLQDTQALADEAFETLLPKLAEGMTERDVAFELDSAMRRVGADGTAFDTIV
ncbi:MAG TPA: aminopeptidase P family N-terminal domain-containing protein, partial [Actinomycetota bacterium]